VRSGPPAAQVDGPGPRRSTMPRRARKIRPRSGRQLQRTAARGDAHPSWRARLFRRRAARGMEKRPFACALPGSPCALGPDRTPKRSSTSGRIAARRRPRSPLVEGEPQLGWSTSSRSRALSAAAAHRHLCEHARDPEIDPSSGIADAEPSDRQLPLLRLHRAAGDLHRSGGGLLDLRHGVGAEVVGDEIKRRNATAAAETTGRRAPGPRGCGSAPGQLGSREPRQVPIDLPEVDRLASLQPRRGVERSRARFAPPAWPLQRRRRGRRCGRPR